MPEGLAVARFKWIDETGKTLFSNPPFKGDVEGFALNMDYQLDNDIKVRAKSPVNAEKMRLELIVFGYGNAEFSNIKMAKYPSGEIVLSGNNLQLWKSYNIKGASSNLEKRDAGNVLSISMPKTKLPYRYPAVCWEDWNVFSFETMADWLNTTAGHIKKKDPTRLVSSYVGWVFGSHSIWDGCMTIQRLDVSLANTPNIEINGIQACIAGEDFTYATFPVDMARKYDKPIYLTDMIDFPYGFYSGFDCIYKGYMAALQHGMDGVFGYCWYANWPPAYNYYTHLTATQLETLVSDTRKGIEYFKGYDLRTNVAFIEPLMTYSLADKDGRKGDNLDCAGLYHLMLDSGYMPDVVTVYEIEKLGASILDKYDCLFISDCPVLKEEVSVILKDFVHKGGTLVSSGALPQFDFKYNKLSNTIAKKDIPLVKYTDNLKDIASANVYDYGKGKVVNFRHKIGRKYWGRVRRWREAGNTPQVYMRLDNSQEAVIKRDYLRNEFVKNIAESGFSLDTYIVNPSGDVHLACYYSDVDDAKLFLVNRGSRQRETVIKLPSSLSVGKKINAVVDFDKNYDISLDKDNQIVIPSFNHSIIIDIK